MRWEGLTKTEAGLVTHYLHDGMGALLSVELPDATAITYEYDGRQRRVGKRRGASVVARLVYDSQARVVAEVDASGAVLSRYVYSSQSSSPEYFVRGGVTYVYVKNHLGSIRFVVNATSGAIAQRLDYDSWGVITADSAPGFQPFAFAGGIFDADTGFTHFGFRDYDAASAAWTGMDPIRLGYDRLSPAPLLQSPEYLRRMSQAGMSTPTYAYAANNPLRYLDPTGLAAECPGGRWFGGPMFVADGSVGVVGGILFGGVYSCLTAPKQVVVVSVCGFASLPGLSHFQRHAACGVGFGWADNTPDLAAFKGWSVGGFFSAGFGANITAFVEGHDASNPDTIGLLIGGGAGFSVGPLGCKTWAWEL